MIVVAKSAKKMNKQSTFFQKKLLTSWLSSTRSWALCRLSSQSMWLSLQGEIMCRSFGSYSLIRLNWQWLKTREKWYESRLRSQMQISHKKSIFTIQARIMQQNIWLSGMLSGQDSYILYGCFNFCNKHAWFFSQQSSSMSAPRSSIKMINFASITWLLCWSLDLCHHCSDCWMTGLGFVWITSYRWSCFQSLLLGLSGSTNLTRNTVFCT